MSNLITAKQLDIIKDMNIMYIDCRLLIDYNKSRVNNSLHLESNSNIINIYKNVINLKNKNIVLICHNESSGKYLFAFLSKNNNVKYLFDYHKIDKKLINTDPYFKYRVNMSEILNNFLFIGDQIDSENIKLLEDKKITNIINCAYELENKFPNKFKYLKLNILDNTDFDIIKYFNEIYDYIENCRKQKCRILIHCYAGISRSATIVTAYMMRKYMNDFNFSHKNVLKYIKNCRHIIEPNAGFLKDLNAYEKILINTYTI
jgi:hypothetical protein